MLQPQLSIIPSVPVWKKGSELLFDRKFYDGVIHYCHAWPGPVRCIMTEGPVQLPDFGIVRMKPGMLPFSCTLIASGTEIGKAHLAGSSIVLASGDAYNQLHIAGVCRKLGIPCVYVIEYIPETRYQIAALTTRNPLKLLRHFLFIWNQEQKRKQAFITADALQSNGTPAYEHYHQATNRLLYFDTRVSKEDLITTDALEQRLEKLNEGKPLRLAFSGRLISMKGADHLVRLALILKQSGMAFLLTIYGKGELEGWMNAFIAKHHLGNHIRMPGALDFRKELLPEISRNTDLFVCLHRQSDPSCTYLETLSCGVPIVGYANRAFSGLLASGDIGWSAPTGDLNGIRDLIIELDKQRIIIAQKARNSILFAKEHDFESTFAKRTEHLLSMVSSKPIQEMQP
ncbi:MAG: glycosyltransferase [Chlorobium sp.]|uniref:glycosyltransferase n=1 Tax=Chlorobium sp. TaxID=1095 RepID=UPI0025C47BFE|nr:glycosyltransferase [Chlorobium sp.]MCF8383069.1 glycosyltransferase [Chlorobium sp.]